MFKMKIRKSRQRLIASLNRRKEAELARLQALVDNPELPQDQWEQREAEGISHLQTINDEIELYQQEELQERLKRAGIEIPDHHIRTGKRRLLTDAGKCWAQVELRKYRDQRIEFWMKLILPILSLIVSIIALVVSIRKH
jgi:rhamnose utilization protein RhaD (predicted bifunctional aldolase and dehydrogenase)